eukprot:1114841-Amphidinium_carterae.1
MHPGTRFAAHYNDGPNCEMFSRWVTCEQPDMQYRFRNVLDINTKTVANQLSSIRACSVSSDWMARLGHDATRSAAFHLDGAIEIPMPCSLQNERPCLRDCWAAWTNQEGLVTPAGQAGWCGVYLCLSVLISFSVGLEQSHFEQS